MYFSLKLQKKNEGLINQTSISRYFPILVEYSKQVLSDLTSLFDVMSSSQQGPVQNP